MFSSTVASLISPKRLAAAALALAVLAACLLVADLASGGAAKIIGSRDNPKPSCPTPNKPIEEVPAAKRCNAINKVTAFQTKAGGRSGVSKVPTDGSIVAWSVDLGAPRTKPFSDGRPPELEFFEKAFDGASTARLAVLKAQGKGKYKLTKQSPTVSLAKSAGEHPIFTLEKPLRVKKGLTVALTTKTWVANFAHDGGGLTASGDRWRASRQKDRCGDDPQKSEKENRDDLFASKPHSKPGSAKTYGCIYTTARVLYTAYLAPDKDKGGGGDGGGDKDPGQNG